MTRPLVPDTMAVLEFVRAYPGCTRQQIKAAVPPHIEVSMKLHNLRTQGHIDRKPAPGGRGFTYTACAKVAPLPRADRIAAKKAREAAIPHRPKKGRDAVAQPRTIDYRVKWTEPYMPDAGMRSSGFDFQRCPSRRGNTFVHCYERARR